MTRTVNGTGQGWDECVSFNPLKDWWVMYEKKSRKRSRDDDDGVDDNRRAVHPFLIGIAHTHTRDLDAVASHTLRPLFRVHRYRAQKKIWRHERGKKVLQLSYSR